MPPIRMIRNLAFKPQRKLVRDILRLNGFVQTLVIAALLFEKGKNNLLLELIFQRKSNRMNEKNALAMDCRAHFELVELLTSIEQKL